MDIAKVSEIYRQLNKHNVCSLATIYHHDVVFEDAAHKLEGWPRVQQYFSALYQNVERCQFVIEEQHQVGADGFLTWTMALQHPKLKSGQLIHVNGATHLKFHEQKVIYHRDYFDLGQMVYEQLPLLGSLIKTIKRRLGQ